ncbi:unnamed protein product [Symbiodinium natans]|uniref:Methyltransferase domain-containing protein n=1 Tax=Symbiodinium natans TaxID=878477 RepID=A0A812IM63_9DINO|nr:unnamed protein product [Symbiodinium natans]
MGIRGAWVINGPDPCELLVRSFDTLEGWLSEWLVSGRPQEVFQHLQRRQFAAAPNISRVEELSHLLHRTAELCSDTVAQPTPDEDLVKTLESARGQAEVSGFLQELGESKTLLFFEAHESVSVVWQTASLSAKVARLDQEELEKEQGLLAESVGMQFGPSEGRHAVDAEPELARFGLLGLVRRAVSAQWVFEMALLAVASWGDRAKRRGNGLQNRLALVKSSLENLHSQLRRLASFRRLAFEEIHSAGWWGRSGSGSSKRHTMEIAMRLVDFLSTIQPGGARSLLDVGCGWGEWVPEALQAAQGSGRLGDFRYLGLDIAWQPIQHLRATHSGSFLQFEVADGVEVGIPLGCSFLGSSHVAQKTSLKHLHDIRVKAMPEDPLPQGYSVAMAWTLLSNLRLAKPDFVILSSWPDSENEDLEDLGGSSAFAAMEPTSLRKFKSYDLRKPPFSLPEPLDSWPEVHQNALMLAYEGKVLQKARSKDRSKIQQVKAEELLHEPEPQHVFAAENGSCYSAGYSVGQKGCVVVIAFVCAQTRERPWPANQEGRRQKTAEDREPQKKPESRRQRAENSMPTPCVSGSLCPSDEAGHVPERSRPLLHSRILSHAVALSSALLLFPPLLESLLALCPVSYAEAPVPRPGPGANRAGSKYRNFLLTWSTKVWAACASLQSSLRPLQEHLKWESLVYLAEAASQEQEELAGQEQLLQLGENLALAAAEVWALASPGQLLAQMQQKGWPGGVELLEAAAMPDDLQRLGEVLVNLRGRIDRLAADWADMQLALRDWSSEAQRQAQHIPINHGILWRQAFVVLNMLSALPSFDGCLHGLAQSKRPRDRYLSALLYVQGLPMLPSMRPRPSRGVFTGEVLDELVELGEASKIREPAEPAEPAELAVLLRKIAQVRQPHKSTRSGWEDWCAGARALYSLSAPAAKEPCETLSAAAGAVLAQVLAWQEPRAFLERVRRFQFSVAPNVSKLEAFVVLITEAGSCALRSEDRGRDELGNHSASDPFPGLRELRELGEADRQSLREERRLLSQGAWQALEVFQHAHQNGEDDSAQGDGSDRSDRSERFLGFLGVIRRVVTAEYVVHLAFEQASTWAFRVRSRGNAMQQRLAQASRQLSEMHTALQALPTYRSLAFEEIHATGHWGRASSGGGSTEAATDELSQRLLRFLVRFGTSKSSKSSKSRPGPARNRLSLLDVGCGWGEWLPTLLRRAVERRMLPAKVFYHGLDIAQRPIRFLRQHFGGCSGACDASFHFTASRRQAKGQLVSVWALPWDFRTSLKTGGESYFPMYFKRVIEHPRQCCLLLSKLKVHVCGPFDMHFPAKFASDLCKK